MQDISAFRETLRAAAAAPFCSSDLDEAARAAEAAASAAQTAESAHHQLDLRLRKARANFIIGTEDQSFCGASWHLIPCRTQEHNLYTFNIIIKHFTLTLAASIQIVSSMMAATKSISLPATLRTELAKALSDQRRTALAFCKDRSARSVGNLGVEAVVDALEHSFIQKLRDFEHTLPAQDSNCLPQPIRETHDALVGDLLPWKYYMCLAIRKSLRPEDTACFHGDT